jgi:hypothetical protein
MLEGNYSNTYTQVHVWWDSSLISTYATSTFVAAECHREGFELLTKNQR